MTDFHILNARVCASVMQWEGRVNGHVVRWEKAPSGAYQMRYVCDCPGFRYRRECRHLKVADTLRCKWGEDAFSGSPSQPNADGSCPDCGGPTVPVRVAV